MQLPPACRVHLSGAASGTYLVTVKQPLTIGRAGRARIFDLACSRLHCRIEAGPEGLALTDLESTNGTYLNERLVRSATLQAGDTIRIGTSQIRVHVQPFREGDARVACVECRVVIPLEELRRGLAVERRGRLLCMRCAALDRRPPRHEEVHALLLREGFRDLRPRRAPGPALLFDALRPELGQPVTLKVLDGRQATKQQVNAHMREARILARLAHRNVLQVHDFNSHGQLVITVLERMRANTLHAEIEMRRRLEPRRVLAVALPLARTIAYLHERRVAHRNIHPHALSIDEDGQLKLGGFELAAGYDSRQGGAACDALLSLSHAAPEVVLDPTHLDPRADVYAFGATLHHALLGHPPDEERQEGFMTTVAMNPERHPVPESLSKLLARCLHTDPMQRYEDGRALLAAVEATIRVVYGFVDGQVSPGVLVGFGPSEILSDTTRRTVGELDGAEDTPAFFGRFTGSELVELAQLIDINRKSGILEVEAPSGERGCVQLKDGHATKARLGEASGREAVVRILSLRSGRFRLIVGAAIEEPEHDLSLSPLLLDVMRQQDESQRIAARPEAPPPPV